MDIFINNLNFTIMSKHSLFWGQASGKLGEAVFYRAKGEQRTRSYVAKIANPKTLAQMSNRVAMLNLVSAYRQLQPVLSKSFVDKKANESDYNAFIRMSKKANTAGVTKLHAADGWVCPFGFQISSGKLNFPDKIDFQGNEDGIYLAEGLKNLVDTNELSQAQIEVLSAITPGNFTGKDYYNMFVGAKNAGNLPLDFKINMVIGNDNGDAWSLSAYQVSVNATSTDKWRRVAGNSSIVIDQLLVPIIEGDAGAKSLTEIRLVDSMDWTNQIERHNTGTAFFTMFISSNESGKLDVSPSKMGVKDGAANESVAEFLPGGTVWEDIISEMGYNPNSILSTK